MAHQSKVLWLLSIDGHHLQCHVNTDQPLADHLKNKYAEAFDVSPSSLILVFDGEKIQDQDTFDSLALEDDDIIDVLVAAIH
ncbi:small ubiquitin-related modifier [Drosophila rhopaloa]|uniref:Ubiquitin-like domain-containing protein n=1 Tax=Drosophila rhopaloa TaxID=1041015 RepID=A0ABM5JGM9_DRORH|nr:small ubiquitin-related modifier [Drosophila rhopaloa]